MTPEQTAAFKKVQAVLAELVREGSRRSLIKDAERRVSGKALGTGVNCSFDRALREFSIVRAIAGAAGLAVDNCREREVC